MTGTKGKLPMALKVAARKKSKSAKNRSTANSDGIIERSANANILPLERNIVHHFVRIVNGLNIKLAESIRVMDVNPVHFRVIQILYEHDGLTITELREQCVIAQAVFSRVLKQVERRKLIRRAVDENDKRVYRIYLTKKGVATYEAALPHASKVIDEALSNLTAADADKLISLAAIVDKSLNP
ncbi:MAG: MarR family transcriptional regulator [Sphingomonadales bacterium]|nr:MarR family transcriptional regulator [Sphingomonadales bacterium]